jgi:hypothetical protein
VLKKVYIKKHHLLQGYGHFYGQGGVPSPQQPCPLWSNSVQLHGQELAAAAQAAREALAADNIRLPLDPTQGIPAP